MMLDRLRSLGRQSQAELDATSAVRAAESARSAAGYLARKAAAADQAAREIMGDEAPALDGWVDWGGSMVLAPLGGPVLFGDEPSSAHDPRYDGQDGELIFFANDRGLWYRPRLTQASAKIRDAAHLGRMINARSIYA